MRYVRSVARVIKSSGCVACAVVHHLRTFITSPVHVYYIKWLCCLCSCSYPARVSHFGFLGVREGSICCSAFGFMLSCSHEAYSKIPY